MNNSDHGHEINPHFSWAGPAAAGAVFLVHCALFMNYRGSGGGAYAATHLPLDDAWIHLAYAKGLLAHGAYIYNPGEIETGATSPLWALLLAAALAVARQPVLAAKALGVALGVACQVASFAELRRAGGRAAAWTGALALALDPMWIMGCLSGMEIPLTGLLLIVLIRQVRLGRPAWAGLAMGLVVLARPEMAPAAAVGGALLVWTLALRIRSNKLNPCSGRVGIEAKAICIHALRCGAVALAASLPWFLYCRLGTGHWLPNTFYAKARGSALTGWPWLQNALQMLEHHYWPSPLLHDPVCLALLALGAGYGALRAARRPALAGWLLFPLAHVAAWSLVNGSGDSGGHPGQYLTFAFTRYYLPDYPLIFGLLGLGAGVAWRGLAALGGRLQTGLAPRADRLLRGALAGMVVLLLAAGNFFGWWTRVGPLWQWGDGYAKCWTWSAHYNTESCRNIYEIHERMGQWIDRNLPPEAVVATQDAGAIRYFARQRLIDLWGLNSHGYLFAADKAAYLRRAGVTVAVVFNRGRLDPLLDFKTGRLLARFRTAFPNLISEEDTMDVREVR